MRSLLERAVYSNNLRSVDLYAGLFAEELTGGKAPHLLLAAALASRSVGDGHICLPLTEVAGRPVFEPELMEKAPALSPWRDSLLASGVVGAPGGPEPLILDEANRLYLARYHLYETIIGDDLRRRSLGRPEVDPDRAAQLLQRLFDGDEQGGWQQLAAAAAVLKQFVVISGGPGTGKTYTVARILALLQALARGSLRIGLAAPTGRAAVRLHESIIRARQTMDEDLAAVVPDETQTIHRLLGLVPHTGRYRHDRNNQLHLDLLVIDEASMVDVPLMAALIEALPDGARLILLGDRDQLTSVEAGSLFGDICGDREQMWSRTFCRQVGKLTGRSLETAGEDESFGDSVALLRTSYRFAGQGGIGELAGAVNAGDPGRLEEILQKGHADLVLAQPDPEGSSSRLEEKIWQGYADCFAAQEPEDAFDALSRFRVLCAVREGPAGVAGINKMVESVLARKGLIRGAEQWYRGRPVIIRKNHYAMQLFNGDTGVCWPDQNGTLQVWFRRSDGAMAPVALSRLPEHDTAYATTIHKAQGSEFDEVLMVLPFEDNRILSRELIYTGITRAKKKLTLYGDIALLANSISRKVVRYSGLADSLWYDK